MWPSVAAVVVALAAAEPSGRTSAAAAREGSRQHLSSLESQTLPELLWEWKCNGGPDSAPIRYRKEEVVGNAFKKSSKNVLGVHI